MARIAGAPVRRKADADPAPAAPAEEVARVAYELFEKRGGIHGHDQRDWFEAERIVAQRQQVARGWQDR